MRLNYKVLWLDDQIRSVNDEIEEVKTYINSKGFYPDFTTESTFTRMYIEKQLSQPWNIIVFDYDTGNAEFSGLTAIDTVRRCEYYTEIVIYTTTQSNLDKIRTEFKEGVFSSLRDNVVEKVKTVIDLTLKKIMDVNVMRGLVLASVAENDFLMNKVLEHILETEPSLILKQETLRKEIDNKIEDTNKRRAQKLDENNDTLISYYINSNILTSETRKDFFMRLGKNHSDCKKYYESIKPYTDILKKRNLLAHGHTCIDSGRECIRSIHENETGIFTLEDALDLRKKLISYKDIFEDIAKIFER
ncbi:MAG: hypothetical protein AB7E48_01010 [Deferribacterales bacterium]